jgi:hypothetical protein
MANPALLLPSDDAAIATASDATSTGGAVAVAEMISGGVLWFPNLMVADVWYGLPLITGMAFLVNIEFNGLVRSRKKKAAPADRLGSKHAAKDLSASDVFTSQNVLSTWPRFASTVHFWPLLGVRLGGLSIVTLEGPLGCKLFVGSRVFFVSG